MNSFTLEGTPFVKKLRTLSLGFIGIGAIGTVGYAISNPAQLYPSYLMGFMLILGISVTAMFFSALQYLANVGWSASVRRIAEMLTGIVPFLVVGMIPIIIFRDKFFHEAMEILHNPAIAANSNWDFKVLFLSPAFFTGRLIGYCVVWTLMYLVIIKNSIKQDTASDNAPTQKNATFAAPFVLLYALTITFAGFDLLMGLQPHWFSTIFGIYVFAGNFVSTLALVTIFAVVLFRGGYLKHYVSLEHFHDFGKFLFAFTVFWTYIAFSQYFLIWYSNIAEETPFYIVRNQNGYHLFSVLLVALHFIVPFSMLLRQDVKKKLTWLVASSVIIIISHVIDLYWMIAPAFPGGHAVLGFFQSMATVLLMFGILLFVTAMQYTKLNLVAFNDPYIKESIHLHS